MKRIALLCILFGFFASPVLSQDLNKKYFDKMVGGEVLIDLCTRSGLEEGSFGQFYAAQYEEYLPDASVVDELIDQLDGIKITMVFGSWCGDSKLQVPRFMKVLDNIDFDEKLLTIIGVDRLKKAHEIDIHDLKIRYVPTFIIYRDEIELGRIIETPDDTLELDLLEILTKEEDH